MAPEAFLTAIREKPFRPFRLNLTDGRTVEVRHPEMIMAGRRTAIIGMPEPGTSEPLLDRWMTVDLIHIVSLEPIQASGTPRP